VPTGRINPYIGVGPAILWSGVDFKVQSRSGDSRFSGDFGASAVNLALVVEPGIRWMCFKNVSVDTFMRYRYAQPAWTVDDITIKATALHQLAFMVRANLHF
jgi:hypothetical protein